MTIEDLYINDYSPKSFVMRGDTKSYKETLKKLGGKYNSRLKDENSPTGVSPGWIFPKTKKEDVEQFLEKGQISEEEEVKIIRPRKIKAELEEKELQKNNLQPIQESCAKCQHMVNSEEFKNLKEEVAQMNQKLDRILTFFEKGEQLRKNVLSGAGNMMKGFFGATAEMMNGHDTEYEATCSSGQHLFRPMDECVQEIREVIPTRPSQINNRIRHMMQPPTITVLDEYNSAE